MRRRDVFSIEALAKRFDLDPEVIGNVPPAVVGALQLRFDKCDRVGVKYDREPVLAELVDLRQVDRNMWADAYTEGARTQIEHAEKTGIFDDLAPTVLELAMRRTHDDFVAMGSFYVHIYNGTEFDR